MAFWAMAIPTAVGLLSGKMQGDAQARAAKQSAKIRAAEVRASPWTGRAPTTQVQSAPSMFGSLLQGGAAGFAQGQAMEAANQQSNLNDLKADYMKQQIANSQTQAAPGGAWGGMGRSTPGRFN